MPKVQIPAALRAHTEGCSQFEADGTSVRDLLSQLVLSYPKIRPSVLDQAGELHSYINLFVDGRNVRDLQQLETPVAAQQAVLILVALSGG
jgi:sulfur-carrier protein